MLGGASNGRPGVAVLADVRLDLGSGLALWSDEEMMNDKDVKVGAIYRCDYNNLPHCYYKIRVDKIKDSIVYWTIIEDTFDITNIGKNGGNIIDVIMFYFEQVYTVEGFEV